MKLTSIIYLFFFISLSQCSNIEYKKEKNILVLTNDNFDKALKDFNHLLVLFYAPWSGPSTKFLPEFERIVSELIKNNITLAKIDCQKQKKIKSKYTPSEYPNLLFFINGEMLTYSGKYNKEKIIEWVKKKINTSPVKEYTKEEDISKAIKTNNVFMIYFGTNESEIKIYYKEAIKHDNILFGICKSEDIAEKFKAKNDTLVLFKKFDDKRNELSSFDEKKLFEFIDNYTIPKITPFSDKVYKKLFIENKKTLLLYAEKNKTEEWKSYRKILTKVADKYKKEMTFILTELNNTNGEKLASQIHVRKKDIPTVRIINNVNGIIKKYKMKEDQEINEENLIKFIKKFKNKKLKPILRSANPPTKNDGDVLVLVGDTYDDEVINNDKDVMVLFYAPWCGHCKSLHPKYEKMAKGLKRKNPKLIISKIDYTENEVENIDLEGFPTIKFYPGNKKNNIPLEYSGDRSIGDMINFIKQNAYHGVNDEEVEEDL